MSGRDKRYPDFLALKVRRFGDSGPIAHHHGLCLLDIVIDIEQLQFYTATYYCGERTRAHHANLNVARCHGGRDLAARVELAPIDLVAGSLLEIAIGYGDKQRSIDLLVADRHGLRLGIALFSACHHEHRREQQRNSSPYSTTQRLQHDRTPLRLSFAWIDAVVLAARPASNPQRVFLRQERPQRYVCRGYGYYPVTSVQRFGATRGADPSAEAI